MLRYRDAFLAVHDSSLAKLEGQQSAKEKGAMQGQKFQSQV